MSWTGREAAFEAAESLIAGGDYGGAVAAIPDGSAVERFVSERPWDDSTPEVLTAALDRCPDNETILDGVVRYQRGRPPTPTIVAALDGLLAADPANHPARATKARMMLDGGQPQEAERVLDESPDGAGDEQLAPVRAKLRIGQARFDDAIDELERAGGRAAIESFVLNQQPADFHPLFVEEVLTRYPDSEPVLDKLVNFYARLPLSRYDELLRRAPDSVAAWLARGWARLDAGHFDDAQACLDSMPEPGRQTAEADRLRRELHIRRRVCPLLARTEYEDAVHLAVQLNDTHLLDLEMSRLLSADDPVHGTRLAAALVAKGDSHAETLCTAGEFYLLEGAYKAATHWLERALEVDRTNVRARSHLCVAYRLTGRLDDAARICHEGLDQGILTEDLDRASALADLAGVHTERNEIDLAISVAQDAREIYPDHAFSVSLQLIALQRAGRLEEAGRLVEGLSEAIRASYAVREQIGYLAAARDMYDSAVEHFSLAFETAHYAGRSPAQAHFELGNGLIACRRYGEAATAFRRARELNPEYVAAHFNEGHVLWIRGRYAEGRKAWRNARNALQRAESRLPDYSYGEIFAVFGAMLLDAESDFRTAEEFLERALGVENEQVDALISLVETRLERYRNARVNFGAERQRAAEDADELEPDDAANLYWSAREAYALGERVLSRLLDRGARPDLTLSLGRLHIAMGEYESAEQVLEPLLRTSADRYEVYGQLGLVYSKQGRFRRAVRALEEALKHHPDHLVTKTNLAEAYRKSGSLADAEQRYREVLRMAPGHVEAQIGLAELQIARADELMDPDLHEQSVSYFVKALALTSSDQGSKAMKRGDKLLRPNDLAASLYSCGYARVQQYETSGPLSDPGLLRHALEDFRECFQADPGQHKAERAMEKIQAQVGRFRPQWLEEKLGPIVIALLAFFIFVPTQSSFFFSWPLKDLGGALYLPMTLGALLFLIAGLFLPRLLRLKVGGIELEKTAVSQVSAPTSFGIGR